MEKILYQALQINGNDITEKTVKNKLPDALDYEQCMRMILDIGAQIELLKEHGIGILFVTKNDVFQLSTGGYILNSDILSFKCNENGEINIDKPFDNSIVGIAPELGKINKLPSIVSYNVAYFSLKQLVLEIMQLEIIGQLEPTKLYYLIVRCSQENPSDRVFILI